jgi:integrase
MASRPLTDEEVKQVLSHLHTARNRGLVVLALKTGYRISELLSLTIQQVTQYGQIKDSITVERKSMKGKNRSRTVALHQDAKTALEQMGVLQMNPNDRLFPICRVQAGRILKEAVNKAQIMGKISFHSARKNFAKKVHEKFGGDIFKTQKALGHASLSSTAHYLQFDQQEIDQAILSD